MDAFLKDKLPGGILGVSGGIGDIQGKPFDPGKHARFHPPDLRMRHWGFSAMPVPNPGLKVVFDDFW